MTTSEHEADHSSGPTATPEEVVVTALDYFSRLGFTEAKLEKIAKTSGMSKRMIHYHFGDKKGLYIRTLMYALEQVRPVSESMQLDTSVPVDGVRKIVVAVYKAIVAHPDAIRLLLMENLHNFAGAEGSAALSDESNVLLHLDKMLMLGQDAGAFRPGISAEDILVLITSLSFYRIANRSLMVNLYELDMLNETNTDGMCDMVVDSVLAFLTSNLPGPGRDSYLVTAPSTELTEPQSAGSIYSFDKDVFEN